MPAVRSTKNAMENNRPKVGVGVYIFNDKNQLLLLQRKGAHGEGSWCPPGGHLEFRESFEYCAIREAKEETGIDIDELKLVGVTNDIFEEGKHYITLAMAGKLIKGKPKIKEPEKTSGIGWFSLSKLPEPLFLPTINLLKTNFDCFCGSGKKYKKCHGR